MEKFIKSFRYAANGLKHGLKERNFRIHLTIFGLVLIIAMVLGISTLEWMAILILSGVVMASELFNTVTEEICDLLASKLHLKFTETTVPRDLSAAAVLVTAIAAIAGGLIIFVPKIIKLF